MASNHKVECQCCGMMMVPKVVTSAPFYISGIPVGGRDPESTVCPFCLSPKWMLTEQQVLTGAKANAEFFGILVLVIINIAVFARLGAEPVGISAGLSLIVFLLRDKIAKALRNRLNNLF